jgi:diaminopimelate decarboxylase
MLTLASKYFQESPPKFIDLGGGFFSKMKPELRNQFDYRVPTFEEYAEAIAPLFRSTYRDNRTTELILEPGLALTADIVQYVCKVLDIKTVRGRTVALTSGSIYNIKPTKSTRNLPLQIYNKKGVIPTDSAQREIDIVGYTCMEDDCLYHDYQGSISIGNYLVFENVGAYTLVLKPPFILPCPPVISYDPSSEEIEIIKNQEEFSDIFATYALL